MLSHLVCRTDLGQVSVQAYVLRLTKLQRAALTAGVCSSEAHVCVGIQSRAPVVLDSAAGFRESSSCPFLPHSARLSNHCPPLANMAGLSFWEGVSRQGLRLVSFIPA